MPEKCEAGCLLATPQPVDAESSAVQHLPAVTVFSLTCWGRKCNSPRGALMSICPSLFYSQATWPNKRCFFFFSVRDFFRHCLICLIFFFFWRCFILFREHALGEETESSSGQVRVSNLAKTLQRRTGLEEAHQDLSTLDWRTAGRRKAHQIKLREKDTRHKVIKKTN